MDDERHMKREGNRLGRFINDVIDKLKRREEPAYDQLELWPATEYVRTNDGREIRAAGYETDAGQVTRIITNDNEMLPGQMPSVTPMIARAVEYHLVDEAREEPEFTSDIAVGGFNVYGEWVDGRNDTEDFWSHDEAELDRIEQAERDNDEFER